MPFYEFACLPCKRQETHNLPWTKLTAGTLTCSTCGTALIRRFSVPSILVYRNAAELAERALRGEEVVPGLTAKESRETAAGMARDRKR